MIEQTVTAMSQALVEVLKNELGTTAKMGVGYAQRPIATTQPMNIVVSIRGQMHGDVIVSISMIAARRILIAGMGPAVPAKFNDRCAQLLSDWARDVCMNAARRLENEGIICCVIEQNVVRGISMKVNSGHGTAEVVPFDTNIGPIDLNISLIETKSK